MLRESRWEALSSCTLLFLLLHEMGDSNRVTYSRDLHDRSIFDRLDRDFVDGARVEFYSFYFSFPLFTPPARLAVTTILILGEWDKQRGGGKRDEGEGSSAS